MLVPPPPPTHLHIARTGGDRSRAVRNAALIEKLLLNEAGCLPSTRADDELDMPHLAVRGQADSYAQPMELSLWERGEASCPTAPPSPPSLTPLAPHKHLGPHVDDQTRRWATIVVALCTFAVTAGLLLRCTYHMPAFSGEPSLGDREPALAEVMLSLNDSRGSMPRQEDQSLSTGETDCPAEWTPLRLRQDGPTRCFRVLPTLKSHYECAAALCSAVDLNGTRIDGTLAMPASAEEGQLLQAELLAGASVGPASDVVTDTLHAAHRERTREHTPTAHMHPEAYMRVSLLVASSGLGSPSSLHPLLTVQVRTCRCG